MPKKIKEPAYKPPIWKQGLGWVKFNPPKNHPLYDEWQKVKEEHRKKYEGIHSGNQYVGQ